jgi:hypothetical protein
LNQSGVSDILRRLLDVEMAKSARQAVTGDGICIGLNYKTNAFVHPKTIRDKELTKLIVDEVRSHEELQNISFTSIQINHNTVSAPHTDNNLKGFPSIAIGLGDYVGGRLRIVGAKQPLHIRDHAVVFDGLETHSSGKFNGDRWSLVLFVHASWETVSDDMAKQLIELGLPCPPSAPTPKPTQAAAPAPSDDATTASLPQGRASRRAGKRGADDAVPAPPNPQNHPGSKLGKLGLQTTQQKNKLWKSKKKSLRERPKKP